MSIKERFSTWLIDLLNRESLTFKELQVRWINSASNIEKKELQKRSFDRYRVAAEEIFKVEILCNKQNGYKYYLGEDFDDGTKKYRDWMLSSFHLSNLSTYADYSKKLILEMSPKNTELLNPILESITNKQSIKFFYRAFLKKEGENFELVPVFMKFFKQRWYVIGEEVHKGYAWTFALDRMSEFSICEGKKEISKKNKAILRPETYFQY